MISVQYLRKDGEDIFYRKAMEIFDDTPRVYLVSYESVIAVADYSVDGGALYITNDDCLLSNTTRRHLSAFIENRRLKKENAIYCDLSKLG